MSRESNTKAHIGKTRRDKTSGAWLRCIQNKQTRADWQNNHKRDQGLKDFPWAICNGYRGKRAKRALGM